MERAPSTTANDSLRPQAPPPGISTQELPRAGVACSRTVQTVIERRRSVRRYTDQAVSQQQLDVLVPAGINAPSGSNWQNQRFLVVDDQAEIARIGAARYVWPYPNSHAAHSRETNPAGLLGHAAALILVFVDANDLAQASATGGRVGERGEPVGQLAVAAQAAGPKVANVVGHELVQRRKVSQSQPLTILGKNRKVVRIDTAEVEQRDLVATRQPIPGAMLDELLRIDIPVGQMKTGLADDVHAGKEPGDQIQRSLIHEQSGGADRRLRTCSSAAATTSGSCGRPGSA